MEKIDDIKKLIRLTGERAKIDARANGTYVVYKDEETGKLVKEYSDGGKEFLPEEKKDGYV
ncbi:hypothetical protein [Paenibacillus hamazuiensis]|uniref:hypothetical protein n=1 Tax=Paenibacillus hamazuiensis TaxID=2936508 RepID=UPI00200D07F5|nr:hypothetical protein [Paenibacillus hamazuiensis]